MNFTLKNIIYLNIVFLFIFSCNINVGIINDNESLNSTISKYLENGSQAVLLVRLEDKNGNKIFQYAGKNDDLVKDQIIDENTWFRIWSMSKIVTISITMDLVEDGIISLDDPVSTYIPEFNNLKVAVTNDGGSIIDYSRSDDKIRYANSGELDIMGKYVPGYEPENKLFLGGEGMIATADGYTDFIRMLLNHGELNGYRFLNESTVKEMYSPHTQLENEYGYNGYNLWVTSELVKEKGEGDKGLWRGGGYEGTHFWIDPKRDFVGVIMSQMFETPKSGEGRDGKIVGEIYRQIFNNEK